MRIQHNIMAMNAYRNYTNNTSAVAKNLEKLSSGYRINRAGDDAAGLAISEKMRAQITGLSAAQKNVKDGISLVKTAEGATQEIHDMLNRMVYLAEQSANGTYQDEVDREAITNEFNQLKSEIDRIADSANFNGIKLLDGSLAKKTSEVPADAAGTQMQDLVVTSPDDANTKVNNIAAKGPSYTVKSLAANSPGLYDAFKISYTNDKGEAKTLYLSEGTTGALTGAADKQGEELANAIKNGTLTVSNLSGTTKADLDEFVNLFKIEAVGTTAKGISFSAKDPSSAAKVTGLEVGQAGNTNVGGAFTNMTAQVGKAEEAAGPQTEVTIANSTTGTANTFQIGSKVYTTSDDVTGAANNAADRAKDLISQLKKDGFDASIKEGTTNTIVIKNLQEAQKGVQIENTASDKWTVKGDVSTKGKTVFVADATQIGGTTAAQANTDYNYTVNYVNAKGESTSKTFTVNVATADSVNLASALKDAISGDSELNAMVKVSTDNGELTMENRASGTGAGYITGISSDSLKVANDQVKVTKPEDTGKVLTLNSGEKLKDGDQVTIDGKTYQFMSDTGAAAADGVIKVGMGDNDREAWTNLKSALAANGVNADVEFETQAGGTSVKAVGLRFVDGAAKKAETVESGGLTLQIGDTSDKFNQLTVSVGDMHVKALGIADLNLGTQEGAQAAVQTIKDAINYVSQERGTLGATQNRLEHTSNNLSVMKENIQDAESSIRDTDIAEEMMAYTKNNILVQSAQAMLAQANQLPQGVLQLLG